MSNQTTTRFPMIDTHTHFDAPVFDEDRVSQARSAYSNGIEHLVLVGYLHRHFARMYDVKSSLDLEQPLKTANTKLANTNLSNTESLVAKTKLPANGQLKRQSNCVPKTHIALGLHPFYIEQHSKDHLASMAKMLEQQRPIAIGEIGLDTFTTAMKEPDIFAKQQQFFIAQLDMAVAHQLPVMLHIRKAHADALAILKAHAYDAHKLGGIAHSFSGGEQEAKAFVKLGFKLGVTGQITNPNAKKLRRAVQAAVAEFGIDCLVIETDCPDMMPINCQTNSNNASALGGSISQVQGQSPNDVWQDNNHHQPSNRNVPANLPWVLSSLSELLAVEMTLLAQQLWQNSSDSLKQSWSYP